MLKLSLVQYLVDILIFSSVAVDAFQHGHVSPAGMT